MLLSRFQRGNAPIQTTGNTPEYKHILLFTPFEKPYKSTKTIFSLSCFLLLFLLSKQRWLVGPWVIPRVCVYWFLACLKYTATVRTCAIFKRLTLSTVLFQVCFSGSEPIYILLSLNYNTIKYQWDEVVRWKILSFIYLIRFQDKVSRLDYQYVYVLIYTYWRDTLNKILAILVCNLCR